VVKDWIYSVPAALLEEAGLRRGGATERAYRCSDPYAVLIPVDDIRAPPIVPGRRRGYELHRLQSVIAAIAANVPLPPVEVYREPEGQVVLLHGAHRLAVSVAYGFAAIPCFPVSRERAEARFNYPDGQRPTCLSE